MKRIWFVTLILAGVTILTSSSAPHRLSDEVAAATLPLQPHIRRFSPGRFIERGSGTIEILIRGTNFQSGIRAYVGNVRASRVIRYGTTTLKITVPRRALAEGRYSLVVRNANGLGERRKLAIRIVAPHLAAAGDIAVCGSTHTADEATATLLDTFTGSILTLGDNAYPTGHANDFAQCYGPSWGRHRSRTIPVIGNHEYQTPNAAGHFSYFGTRAGDPAKGYFAQTVGDWRVVVINSNCGEIGGCGTDSPQGQWLAAELRDSATRCTIAAMHHPRFSTSLHGDNAFMDDIWKILVANQVDVVLAGHDHNYQRFNPMDAAGIEASGGSRLFVVGTGGADLYNFFSTNAAMAMRDNSSHGYLDLTLHPSSYGWNFVAVPGDTFADSGTSSCH